MWQHGKSRRRYQGFALLLAVLGGSSVGGAGDTAESSSAPTDAIGITSSVATVLPSMSTARTEHTATLLAGGQVLIAGGSPTFVTAELYEPAQQAFRPIADMTYGRREHTATLLCDLTPPCGNDKVLIAGGVDQSGIPLSTAELYIPASATFTLTHPMTTARVFFTATLLGTKQVLMAGGDSTGTTAELFEPTTRTFTRTGTMNRRRVGHAAVLLTDGRVLITGGDAAGNTAEIFDPKTGRFSLTGSMLQSRRSHTATQISGGNVLITGGEWATGIGSKMLSSAEIYEPASGRFFAIQPMSYARADHTATALADGTVLVAGGATQIGGNICGYNNWFFWVTGTVERFDPRTHQFTLISADFLPVPRHGQKATRLLTGDVLVTGGQTLVRKSCYYGGRYPAPYELPTTTATAQMIR